MDRVKHCCCDLRKLGLTIARLFVLWLGFVFFCLAISSASAAEISMAEAEYAAIGAVVAIVVGSIGAAIILPLVGAGYSMRFLWKRGLRSSDYYNIWYGTNRNIRGFLTNPLYKPDIALGPGVVVSYGDAVVENLYLGKCQVCIPKGHIFGSTGSSRVRRWFQRFFFGQDDKLTLNAVSRLSVEDFERSIRSQIEQFDPGRRSVLIFIHGYNTDFEEAAVRAAQIGFDLKIPGAMALFSWPSKGRAGAYVSDLDSIAASESALVDFIKIVAKSVAGSRINILAHSMGNLGLIRALNAGIVDARLNGVRFGQIILAAPDIDVRLFRRLSKIYPYCSENTTLYISSIDKALHTSNFVHENQRTGYSPPVTVIAGIDTIEATNVDLGLLGHGYFAEASSVLHDMWTLIQGYTPPHNRPGLYPERNEIGETYWVIRANRS